MVKKKYYKVWLHLEEITIDEEGKDADYKSLDDEILPLGFGKFKTKKRAIEIMEQNHDFWDER